MELQKQFSHITQLIIEAKQLAYQAINHELVTLYWNIGEYLHTQVSAKAWGKAVVQELAAFIAKSEPNIKGFSAQNLWRMKQFYETYKNEPKLSALLREIPWTSNAMIFTSCKTMQEREFYLRLTLKERLSSRELERQINTSYYERVMFGNANLNEIHKLLPQDITNVFKDTYVLELLHLPDIHAERDLQKSIAQNITRFLLEFGRDFAHTRSRLPNPTPR